MVGENTLAGIDWIKVKRSLTREAFAQKYPVPFLLRKAPRAFPTPGGEEPPTAPSHLGFHTKIMDPTRPAPPPQRLPGVLVMPLTKVEGGAFAERISVGRALNCDVVIRDESVSKLHAYFRIVTATSAEVTDAKSANRTLVNAKIVEPGQTARVAVGDTLIFGRVALQFMDAASTYDWI